MSVRIPSNIDQEDRILAGLTARQLAIIALPAVLLWASYFVTRAFLPLYVFGPIAIVLSGIVGTVAVVKRDGISMDRFALAAIRYHRQSRQLVPEVPDVNASGLAAIPLPVVGVRSDGVIDLGDRGAALICRVDAIDIGLLSEVEQEATTAAFGRFANSLQAAVQFVLHTEAVDLAQTIDALRSEAKSLASVLLERAATEHCAFLSELSLRHDVLQRKAYVIFKEDTSVAAGSSLLIQRATEATAALRSAGVELHPLSATEAARAIQSSCGSTSLTSIEPDKVVTGIQN